MVGTVLIVDDDQYIRVILEKRLTMTGLTVFTAEDGEEALRVAHEKIPDVIVSDWMMPVMNGIELCQKVKSDELLRYSYFILLTARDTQNDKIEAIEQGADDYLTKPFNDRDVMMRIKAGLRINQLQKELAGLEHEKALIELAITLGHEINNPLGIIMLILQVFQRKPDSVTLGQVRKELDICLHNGKRISEIVKKLSTTENPQLKPYLKNSATKMLDLSHPGSSGEEKGTSGEKI